MSGGAWARRPVIWIAAAVVALLVVTGVVVVYVTRTRPAPPLACPPGDVQRVVEAVSEDRIRATLERLVQGDPDDDVDEVSRHVSSPGNDIAVEWIGQQFADAGLDPQEQEFRSGGRRLSNVLATVPGGRSDVRVGVGAHLDSISEDGGDAPGADDNASGVAAVLEAARVLKSLPSSCLSASIDFVAFNDEEEDMRGSGTYARSVSASMRAFINIDMIGYGTTPCVNASYNRGRDEAVAERIVAAGQAHEIGLDLPLRRYRTDDQDGASFWAEGLPVSYLYECTETPHYHTSGDELETLNIEQIALTTKVVVASLVDLASNPPAS